MEVVELLDPIWRESSSFTKSLLPVVFSVEESVNSVWVFLKAQAGISLTTATLNLSSSDKVKVATSLPKDVATAFLNSKNFVSEATEVALLKEDPVVDAKATPRPMDANIMTLNKTGTVTMKMPLIMPDFPTWKLTEEARTPSASLVLLTLEDLATVEPVSALNIHASEQALIPKFK